MLNPFKPPQQPLINSTRPTASWGMQLLLSSLTERRRAQELRRKTLHMEGRAQVDGRKERTQGNGTATVRVMRHQARTRRGGGIPPTKHRDANGGCSAREESSFSPKRATSMRCLDPAPEGAKRGHGRGLAERTEAGGDELCRTRPRSRICIRRAGRRTHKTTALHREHGCPDRDRTLEGKPTQTRGYSARRQTQMRVRP